MLGDIVGKPGRRVVQQQMPSVRQRYSPDLIIANGENIAGGSGITEPLFDKLIKSGIHGVTLGDHAFRQREGHGIIRSAPNLIRPANLPARSPGRPWMKLQPPGGGPGLYVITVLGRIYMNGPYADDPFVAVDRFLEVASPQNPCILVEIHAETSSEKQALAHYLDGRVSAVLGSHTHVPTADARILPGGTAYITDLGMCGPYDSVIGRLKDRVVHHMTTGMPSPFDVAEDDPRLSGVFVKLDDNGRATHIERFEFAGDVTRPPFTDKNDRE